MDRRENELIKLLKASDILIDEGAAGKLIAYMDLLLEKNKVINLTRITDPQEFMALHLLDSLSLLPLIPPAGQLVLDVGTGGGFPGIPLAIVLPEKNFVLLDSTRKKLKVVEEIAGQLRINNVTIIHGRAEELGRDEKYRGRFDVVASRAVADLTLLMEYCLPFVKKKGLFLAMKGKGYEEELSRAQAAVSKLGGEIKEVNFLLQRDYDHVIIVTEKIKTTPYKYPRSSGKIKKNPLA